METRSLALALLLPFLLSAGDAHAPSPSPSPSPSRSPSPRRTPPKQVASTSLQLPPPPPPQPPPPPHPRVPRGRLEHQAGADAGAAPPENPKQLNLGEKVGLAFLVVAVVLQVAFGGFLVFKRSQLSRMVRGDRRLSVPSLVQSP